jgi:transcription elongation factor Elf1
MTERIHRGTYYKLTDEDRHYITKYFNDQNLEELLGFCDALAQVASYNTWNYAESYLYDVGLEKFFRSCSNCGNTFDCAPDFALNECGDWYEEWVPMSEEQENRLEELKSSYKREN